MSYIRDFFSGQKKSLKPKRNFIKENIKRLQEVSKNRNVEPTTVKSGPFPKFHHSLADYKDQAAGPGYHFRREGSNLSLNQARLKDSYKFHPAGLRNQSSQTLEENDLESLYHEGVIRFPSNRKMGDETKGQVKLVRTICLQTDTPVHSRSPSPSINGSPGGDSVKDFVKMNAQVQSSPKRLQSQRSQDPIKPPPYYQMGVLPKYLREQKKEQEKMQKASDEMDPECPPGHTVLPEAERLKHLAQLKQRYLELVSELNSIPVRNDTLRNRKRKMELEKELDKVDAGIKLFSRDKLFIKITN